MRYEQLHITVVAKEFVYAMVVLLISVVGVGAASMLYANHVATSSDRQWCDLLTALDNAYKQEPSDTATGTLVASEIRRLVLQFNC